VINKTLQLFDLSPGPEAEVRVSTNSVINKTLQHRVKKPMDCFLRGFNEHCDKQDIATIVA